MPRLLIAGLSIALYAAAAQADPVPAALQPQLERIAALVSDGYAVGMFDTAETSLVNAGADNELLLALFVVEGHGGGNGYVQLLAAFTAGADAAGKPWYTLVDFLPVGGKGWRAIDGFAPRVSADAASGITRIELDVLENAADDAPNFPSRKARLRLELRNGRFVDTAGT